MRKKIKSPCIDVCKLKMMFALVVVEQAIKFVTGQNLDQIKEIKLYNN